MTPQDEREAIARVVDPYAWRAYDATLLPFVEGRGAHEGESWHVRAYLAGCRNAEDASLWWQETADSTEPVTVALFRDSLAKADAILALRQPGAEYRRGIEDAAMVAERDSTYVSDHPYYAPQDRAKNATRKAIATAIRALTDANNKES